MRRLVAPLAAVLVLGACSDPAPQEAVGSEATASPQEEVLPATLPSPADAAMADPMIPQALRGEWGINEADCDASRADAKGNLSITGDSLKFYESIGRLGRVDSISKVGIGATFAFSGEGQTWEKWMQFELADDGKSLIRTERGPEAIAEPLTYKRCGE